MAVQVELLESITYFSGLPLNELGRIKDLIFEKAADRERGLFFTKIF